MKKLATHLALTIRNKGESQVPVEIVSYGLEIVLNLGTQLTLLAIISYLLDIFPTVMIAVLAAIIFRTFSGGNHFSTFISCTVVSILLFIGIGYLAKLLSIRSEVIIILFFTNACISARWAPYNPKRKYSESKKRALKFTSVLLLLGTLNICLLLPIKDSLVTAMALGLTWQTLSITPLGVAFIRKADVLINIGKEGK